MVETQTIELFLNIISTLILGSILGIIPNGEGDFESDTTSTLRDFKIRKIMDERDR